MDTLVMPIILMTMNDHTMQMIPLGTIETQQICQQTTADYGKHYDMRGEKLDGKVVAQSEVQCVPMSDRALLTFKRSLDRYFSGY